VKAKYPGVYDDLPTASVAGAHPEAKISAAPAGFGERMLSAVGPAIRGAGDVTGVNRLLEATGAVDPGRLTGDEANPRDASTRTATAIGGGAAMGAEAVAGLVKLAQQGGIPAVMKGVAAMTVVPAVKYELTKQALSALHFPSAAAIPIALMVSGYQRGKASLPPEAAAATPAAVDVTESAQAARAARAAAFGTPAAPPEAPVSAQAQTPTPAPVASPAPAQPAAVAPEAVSVQQTHTFKMPRTQAEADAAAAPMSTPDAFRSALKAFADAKEVPRPAEVNNVQMLIKRGVAPDKALQTVLGNRPPAPANPAAELAKRLGTPSEAEMNADMLQRAVKGQKSLMPKYAGDAMRAQQPAVESTITPAAAAEPVVSDFGITSKAAITQEEANTVNEAVKSALDHGYKGDLEELHASLTQKMQDFKGLQADTNQTHPNEFLRAVAKGGGISETNESALKGEIAALKQDRDLAPSTSRKNLKAPPRVGSTMQGVSGVFKESGLSMDQMLEYIQEDGRWPHIKTIQDLTDAIRGAARTAPTSPIEHVTTFKSYVGNAIARKQFGLLLAAAGSGAALAQENAAP
jgi:hypothetical protein